MRVPGISSEHPHIKSHIPQTIPVGSGPLGGLTALGKGTGTRGPQTEHFGKPFLYCSTSLLAGSLRTYFIFYIITRREREKNKINNNNKKIEIPRQFPQHPHAADVILEGNPPGVRSWSCSQPSLPRGGQSPSSCPSGTAQTRLWPCLCPRLCPNSPCGTLRARC